VLVVVVVLQLSMQGENPTPQSLRRGQFYR